MAPGLAALLAEAWQSARQMTAPLPTAMRALPPLSVILANGGAGRGPAPA